MKDDLYDRYGKALREAGQAHPGEEEESVARRAVVSLIREGYPVKDLQPCVARQFLASHDLTEEDSEGAQIYTSRVMETLNEALGKASREDPALAAVALKSAIEADQNRYADTASEAPYGLYRKGRVLSALAVEDGFTPDAIKEALRDSKALALTPEEEDILMDGVRRTDAAYDSIRKTPLSGPSADEGALYRRYAHAYMDRTGSRFLSQTDEIRITSDIYGDLRELYAKELPKTEEGQRELEHILTEEVWPFLHRCINKGSPNLMAPGRDGKTYAASILAGARTHTSVLSYGDSHLRALDSYVTEMSKARDISQKLVKELPSYSYDVLAVRKMLDKKHPQSEIRNAIVAKSPIARTNQNPKGSGRSSILAYATWIIHAALAMLGREKQIASAETKVTKTGTTASYNELVSKGVTSNDLFLAAYRDRWERYPSSRQELIASNSDRAVASNLLARYPDYDRNALEESIRELSPGAVFPGVPDSYAHDIVHQAAEDLALVRSLGKERDDFRLRYQKARGFASAGIEEHNAAMDRYLDGRTALYFLRQNEPESNLRPLLIESCPKECGLTPVLYADDILRQSREVLTRTDALLETRQSDAQEKTPKGLYQSTALKYFQKKGFVDSRLDVAVYEELALRGVPQERIDKSIREGSPKAAEPGRSASVYTDYIRRRAEREIEEAKRRLEEYQVIPHMGEHDIAQDFRKERLRMQEYVRLPLGEAIDEKITDAYLDEGIEEKKIVEALNENTETVGMKEASYGHEILSRVKTRREKEDKKKEAASTAPSKEHEDVRVRRLEGQYNTD